MFIERTEKLISFNEKENEVRIAFLFKIEEKKLRCITSFRIESNQEREFEVAAASLRSTSFSRSLGFRVRNFGMIENNQEYSEELKNLDEAHKKEEIKQKERMSIWSKKGFDFYQFKTPIMKIEEYSNGNWNEYLTKKVKRFNGAFKVYYKTYEKKKIISMKAQKEFMSIYGEIALEEIKRHFSESEVFRF